YVVYPVALAERKVLLRTHMLILEHRDEIRRPAGLEQLKERIAERREREVEERMMQHDDPKPVPGERLRKSIGQVDPPDREPRVLTEGACALAQHRRAGRQPPVVQYQNA